MRDLFNYFRKIQWQCLKFVVFCVFCGLLLPGGFNENEKKSSLLFLFGLFYQVGFTGEKQDASDLDLKVKKFLQEHKYQWYRMNVPESDGKVLYDVIIKNKYKRASEIGTTIINSSFAGISVSYKKAQE